MCVKYKDSLGVNLRWNLQTQLTITCISCNLRLMVQYMSCTGKDVGGLSHSNESQLFCYGEGRVYTITTQKFAKQWKHEIGISRSRVHRILNHKTPWPETTSELYRPSDRWLSAKLVPTFADRGCHVVSVADPYSSTIAFLDHSSYFFFQVAPQLYSKGWVDPIPDPLLLTKSGNWTWTSGSVARNSDNLNCAMKNT
jgi:hypothetical protein